MHMNISYINMCKLKKNRRRKELEKEREIGGDGVCGCSFGEPLKQETLQTSFKHVLKNNFILFI